MNLAILSKKILLCKFFNDLALSLFTYIPSEQHQLCQACIIEKRFKNQGASHSVTGSTQKATYQYDAF